MGALLSQAVADQLRQFPGSQDPRPSPSTLIQQVLNQPGASLPTWMAPIMERQQLLATNTPEANQALTQDALKNVMAFGGADITKEQRAAWEAENAAYRRQQFGKEPPGEAIAPGTRVYIRPDETFLRHTSPQGLENFNGKVVTPGKDVLAQGWDPIHAEPQSMTPPSPEHVAVSYGNDPRNWFWRHPSSLEVLRPEEKFQIGDKVEQNMDDMIHHQPRDPGYMGQISEPPPNAPKPPGYGYPDFNPSDWVWADVDRRYKPLTKDIVRYKGGAWGAWFHKTFWNKKGK